MLSKLVVAMMMKIELGFWSEYDMWRLSSGVGIVDCRGGDVLG